SRAPLLRCTGAVIPRTAGPLRPSEWSDRCAVRGPGSLGQGDRVTRRQDEGTRPHFVSWSPGHLVPSSIASSDGAPRREPARKRPTPGVMRPSLSPSIALARSALPPATNVQSRTRLLRSGIPSVRRNDIQVDAREIVQADLRSGPDRQRRVRLELPPTSL